MLDNTLDQMDLGVEKGAICEGRVVLEGEGIRNEIVQHLESLRTQNLEGALKVKAVEVAVDHQGRYPSVTVDVTWEYPSFTMVGRKVLGPDIRLESHRIRALPLDN